MFQLDNAIENWRNGLLQNQSMQDSDIDELESHLRDEVDSLMLGGFSDEEAFMVSAHRMGDHQAVGQEFAKVNPSLAWRRRAFWMFFGILVSMLVTGVASVCSSGSAALLIWLDINGYISGASGGIHVGVFAVILFSVVFGLSLFTKAMKRNLSVTTTLIVSVLSIFILKAIAIVFDVIGVRFLGVEAFGEIALARSYANLAWSILWPLIVVMMLFKFWSSRPQRVR